LNANGLEIKQRSQRGMTFLDLTLIFFIVHFYGEKMEFRFWSKIRGLHFSQKYDFSTQFFNRSLAKLSRTAKIPTVLSSSTANNLNLNLN